MLPDGWEDRLNLIKLIGGAVAGVGLIGAAYLNFGGPVPASRDWVTQYHEGLAERDEIARLLTALDKALVELGPGDTRDALEAQRDALQARLDG